MIVVDMESSGLDPHKDGLLSIGAVDFSNPKNTFYAECRLWDGGHADQGALNINGFTMENVHDSTKQTEAELVAAFIRWSDSCKEKTIAGQNPATDREFIRIAAHRAHLNWMFAYRTIDLHSVAYTHMIMNGKEPPRMHDHSALNLDAISVYCGMFSEPKPHNGLTGAKLEAECFSRLWYNKPFFDEYKEYLIPWKK
ncbi:MAG: hypothetical protein A2664_03310 [Candidatus Taylorbacteria bacterium RIFCSPHIGHO2_01_FULL_46_22b]|uniref:Exonuclease domain-containing protein n=1 Tax=Candidatus Taylorbacteria bacterium RIFCSPHIGHO2_01_FULL_46_22b TaxID=1802301 RepID=A0A1G2M1E0_9BACT|nr:MAG: hypothetical protein A2664_03310 [Candidatus Taylorbacteria bacterium RIFCSPHIGHO2_01_FULL_46_22b]